MRRLLDTFVKWLARISSRVFYRHIETIGLDNVPGDVPVVYVINHFNLLVDPILVLGFLPRFPRFLAASMLWDKPFLRPFLFLAGVLPVYRPQESESYASQNEGTFARCEELLARGGAIALFPEGTSHDASALQPLKTGAARIVLGTEQRFGRPGTRIVPVGLTFDKKQSFRSRVLIKVGEAIDPLAGPGEPDADNRDQVRALTDRIRDGLEAVTLNYPSWEEARLIERAVELCAPGDTGATRHEALATSFDMRKAFTDGYELLQEHVPEKVSQLARAVRAYDRMLYVTALRPQQVTSQYTRRRVAAYVIRSIVLFVVRLPLAIVGIVQNFVPYWIVRFAGEYARAKREDMRASIQIMAGMVLFPATWILWGVWAGLRWGETAGLWVAVLGPVSGVFAVAALEQRRKFFEEARAYIVLRTHEDMARELASRRDAITRGVAELAAERERLRGGAGTRAPG